jgi:hypothetical protein
MKFTNTIIQLICNFQLISILGSMKFIRKYEGKRNTRVETLKQLVLINSAFIHEVFGLSEKYTVK